MSTANNREQNDGSATAGGANHQGLVSATPERGRGAESGNQYAPQNHRPGATLTGRAGQTASANEAARSSVDADSVNHAVANAPIVARLDQRES